MRSHPSYPSPGGDAFSGNTNDNIELLKAWAGTSLAFAVAMLGGQILVLWQKFPMLLLVAAVTCGIGFVLHELAHRILARGYGAEAHFVADDKWLIISIVIAFGGFFVAAPGAVWHRGLLTKQQGGIIALGGPVTNLVLALLFLAPLILFNMSGFWGIMMLVGFRINSWLGLFNMIPFGPFDGAKVLNWSPVVFGITVAVAVIEVFVLPGLFHL